MSKYVVTFHVIECVENVNIPRMELKIELESEDVSFPDDFKATCEDIHGFIMDALTP